MNSSIGHGLHWEEQVLKWLWSWEALDAVLLFGVLAALLRFRQRAARRRRIVREERLRHFRMS
jgi:hypothetical protein